jgi:hypothetical protein
MAQENETKKHKRDDDDDVAEPKRMKADEVWFIQYVAFNIHAYIFNHIRHQ